MRRWLLPITGTILAIALGVLVSCRLEEPAVAPLGIAVGRTEVSATTSGADGSATGTGYTDAMVRGAVMAVYVDYGSSMAATTDLTLAAKSAPTESFVSLSDQATDKWVYPRRMVQDNTGTDVTFDGTNEIYEPYWVDDYVTLSIAQSTPTKTVKCYIYWQR